jgi:DNA-binding response OmpR family regulator
MRTLLVVEDEFKVLRNHLEFLEGQGYRVLPAENLAQARGHLSNGAPDAIVLDIMLPDGNGLDLLAELRAAGRKIPVIILTAWGEPKDVSRGLRLGANDYLSKPFEYDVLLARVEAMFRNVETVPAVIEKGAIKLKIRPMELLFGNQKIKLPPVEFFLLQLFVENEGAVMRAERLYEEIWGADMAGDPDAVRKAVSRLRKKIEGSGYTINTLYGEGYRFEREPGCIVAKRSI